MIVLPSLSLFALWLLAFPVAEFVMLAWLVAFVLLAFSVAFVVVSLALSVACVLAFEVASLSALTSLALSVARVLAFKVASLSALTASRLSAFRFFPAGVFLPLLGIFTVDLTEVRG